MRAAEELGMSYVAGVEHRAGRAALARGLRWNDQRLVDQGAALIDAGARHAVHPNIFMPIWLYRAAAVCRSRDASRRWADVQERVPDEGAGTVMSHVNLLRGLRESDIEAVELARDGFAQQAYLKGVHDAALRVAAMRLTDHEFAPRRICEDATLAYLIAERLGLPTAAQLGRWLRAYVADNSQIDPQAVERSLEERYPTLFAAFTFRLPSGLEFSDGPAERFPGPRL
jgi:hypothetical protein